MENKILEFLYTKGKGSTGDAFKSLYYYLGDILSEIAIDGAFD